MNFDYDIFNYCEFRDANSEDIIEITKRFQNCDFFDDYIEHTDDPYYKVLLCNNVIIGIVALDDFNESKFDNHSNNRFYYVSSECTSDKSFLLEENNNPARITNGRLLWCYILNYIFTQNKSKHNFIVYNEPTDESIGYHLKMGMLKASKLQNSQLIYQSFEQNKELNVKEVEEYEDDSKFVSFDEAIDETYLFYKANTKVNYNDMKSIIDSLPKSSSIFNFALDPTKLVKNSKKRKRSLDEEMDQEYKRKRQRKNGGKKKRKTRHKKKNTRHENIKKKNTRHENIKKKKTRRKKNTRHENIKKKKTRRKKKTINK